MVCSLAASASLLSVRRAEGQRARGHAHHMGPSLHIVVTREVFVQSPCWVCWALTAQVWTFGGVSGAGGALEVWTFWGALGSQDELSGGGRWTRSGCVQVWTFWQPSADLGGLCLPEVPSKSTDWMLKVCSHFFKWFGAMQTCGGRRGGGRGGAMVVAGAAHVTAQCSSCCCRPLWQTTRAGAYQQPCRPGG